MIRRLDGRKIAQSIIESLKTLPRPQKSVAAFYIGEDSSSISFLKQKKQVAETLGVPFSLTSLAPETTETAALEEFREIAADPSVGGIILQLPLPATYNRENFFNLLSPEKDIDNLTGRAAVLMPSILTVDSVVRAAGMNLRGIRAAVLGRGFLIGDPVARWLSGLVANVSVIDAGDDRSAIGLADLVVSGVGQAGVLKPEALKPGALVIDFGYAQDSAGHLVGDFDARSVSPEADLTYTPTPGGTGPILVAKLFENFYRLNQ